MTLGYTKPLYLLAFDHRGSFERDLFGASPPISDNVRAAVANEHLGEGRVESVDVASKFRAILEVELGLVPHDAAGILVDEQYAATVARKSRSAHYLLAMPVEKSGQPRRRSRAQPQADRAPCASKRGAA